MSLKTKHTVRKKYMCIQPAQILRKGHYQAEEHSQFPTKIIPNLAQAGGENRNTAWREA
jgi:hypothetical protein